MSAAKHTPGPWRRGSDALESDELFSEVYGPNGALIATCHVRPRARGKEGREAADYARGNAERIVQCVNACQGIPLEVLQAGASGGLPWSVLDQLDERALRDELLAALRAISLCSQNSMSSKDECGRIARAALAKADPQYGPARIAWELERTALGDGFYGNALRVAKDIPGLTDADRALLDRYAAGRNNGTDHVALQDLAMRIDSLAKAGGAA